MSISVVIRATNIKASMLINDLGTSPAIFEKKKRFPVFFSLSFFFLKSAIDGFTNFKKKSEGRGSQRGVIGDGLTDGRNPPLFF